MSTQDTTRRAPSIPLALLELPRALADLSNLQAAAPLLRFAPAGDGHPVLVMPGFMAGERSLIPLRRFLTSKGYSAETWGLGQNLGPRAIGKDGELLAACLMSLHRRTGRKVSIIGWSLGGIMARELAKMFPDEVRQVISLGSPFSGDPRASNVFRLYQYITGQQIDPETMSDQFANLRRPPPGVPSTAIYSKTDGVVAWQNCVEDDTQLTDNIEVQAAHCGLGVNPAVFFAIADRLALPENGWEPFDRTSATWRRIAYPSSGHIH